jgi:UDP-glucose 4-epimerase
MRVLVTGGAGYVGSVSVERLVAAGHDVVVLDSLVTGHRAAVPREARLVVESTRDQESVERLMRRAGIDAVLHCAARSLVPESMTDPALYYAENVGGGIALLDAMLAADVGQIVFSSTAAVYGEPEAVPITEDAPLRPINPYGETKRSFEGAMRWYAAAFGLRCVSLRYFNVAGASEVNGEDHKPETHLVPNILRAALGHGQLTVHGDDYPTPDGTPIRDYIHVEDLADAHLAALELTEQQRSGGSGSGESVGVPDVTFAAINLGSGTGFTVRQVLAAAEVITGREIPQAVGPRRPGDPPALVSSNDLARRVLGWEPRRGTLDEMIGSAWRWREAHPNGYGD